MCILVNAAAFYQGTVFILLSPNILQSSHFLPCFLYDCWQISPSSSAYFVFWLPDSVSNDALTDAPQLIARVKNLMGYSPSPRSLFSTQHWSGTSYAALSYLIIHCVLTSNSDPDKWNSPNTKPNLAASLAAKGNGSRWSHLCTCFFFQVYFYTENIGWISEWNIIKSKPIVVTKQLPSDQLLAQKKICFSWDVNIIIILFSKSGESHIRGPLDQWSCFQFLKKKCRVNSWLLNNPAMREKKNLFKCW